jgi:hypothetical protein
VVVRRNGKAIGKKVVKAGSVATVTLDTSRFSTKKKNVVTVQYMGNKRVYKSAKDTVVLQRARAPKKSK